MPVGEYKCRDCGKTFEKNLRPTDDPEQIVCPACYSKSVEKLTSEKEGKIKTFTRYFHGGG